MLMVWLLHLWLLLMLLQLARYPLSTTRMRDVRAPCVLGAAEVASNAGRARVEGHRVCNQYVLVPDDASFGRGLLHSAQRHMAQVHVHLLELRVRRRALFGDRADVLALLAS